MATAFLDSRLTSTLCRTSIHRSTAGVGTPTAPLPFWGLRHPPFCGSSLRNVLLLASLCIFSSVYMYMLFRYSFFLSLSTRYWAFLVLSVVIARWGIGRFLFSLGRAGLFELGSCYVIFGLGVTRIFGNTVKVRTSRASGIHHGSMARQI